MPFTTLLHALSTPSLGGIDGSLAGPLMSMLLNNKPVPVDELATRLGVSPDEASRRLAAMPEAEFNDAGDVVGYVLTRVETPHRFRVCDTQLYTWCPLDTVIVPRLVGRTAHVEGTCAQTGEKLQFISTPEGLHCRSHPDIAISLPEPDDLTHLRSAFCQKVRFFTSSEAASTWLGPDRECHVLTLDEAYALASTLVCHYLQRDVVLKA